MFKRVEKESGFTLIELLIAFSILAIGLLALATMLASGMSGNLRANLVTVESAVAYSVMDEVMARDTGNTVFDTAQVDTLYDLDTGTAATTRTVQNTVYAATFSITPNTPVIGVAQVDITVTSPDRTVNLTAFKRSI
ncbi:MAG: prepilin-type N-terminal cleavage/methylation domain-containing protein [Deltaproteobacteria bacterium]|nr:prepilin-type N-terminal cleavage/methylation domain-containing protein [Deltaproteobacteria bacterium]